MIMQGILQSQGRLLRKMRFMPSSLSSKSHRLLTALVDSRHKKVYKVKNCITDIDPEREKEEKEKVFKEWMLLSLLILPCFGWVVSCPSVILLRKKKKKPQCISSDAILKILIIFEGAIFKKKKKNP